MIKSLKLTRFKGFKSYSVRFSGSALLLGPNNAGKSTLIAAIRLCNEAARFATRNRPCEHFSTDSRTISGYLLSKIRTDSFSLENVRHEFANEIESRLEVQYESGAVIRVIWPPEDPPYFWLDYNGSHVRTAAAAKPLVSIVGIAPTLTPLERNEKRLSSEHLKSHIETRLCSRHFRNHLMASKSNDPQGHEDLKEFLLSNTPELTGLEITSRRVDGEDWIDVFYMDRDSRTEKELYWAGDGIQIWLQLLFHLWRTRSCPSVLLDEPDVFLHPDLQRRLVRVVEAANQQVIMSSHAAEVASEAQPSTLVWVERSSRSAVRNKDGSNLDIVADGLGSSFNLSLARALKSKSVLFVEGEDMKILRIIAEKISCPRLATEQGLAIVPIGGFARWPSVESFSMLSSRFLGDEVSIRLILDRDYRGEGECQGLQHELRKSGVDTHVWKKKEFESYLVSPPLIARLTGLSERRVQTELDEIAETFYDQTFGHYAARLSHNPGSGNDAPAEMAAASHSFRTAWEAGLEQRLAMIPPKAVISSWNNRARVRKFGVLSARKLAGAVTVELLDWEMVELFRDIEADLDGSGDN